MSILCLIRVLICICLEDLNTFAEPCPVLRTGGALTRTGWRGKQTHGHMHRKMSSRTWEGSGAPG